MPGSQRILVVSTAADDAELKRIRGEVGRNPVVVTAPTADAKRVVQTFGVEPTVEILLTPTSYPPADRGHQLDVLVRTHALRDRYRDVVVVTDTATSTLLLRVLAPDQLSGRGAVTVVGLPRGDRPLSPRRVAISGIALGVVTAAAEPLLSILVLPAVAAVVGLLCVLVPASRHLGRELLLAAALGLAVVLLVVASSERFPGSW